MYHVLRPRAQLYLFQKGGKRKRAFNEVDVVSVHLNESFLPLASADSIFPGPGARLRKVQCRGLVEHHENEHHPDLRASVWM